MATKPSKSGEPVRISIPQQVGKPIQVVADDDGCPVMDERLYLAWHKATGYYYVGRGGQTWADSNLRTRDRQQAVFRYREWIARRGSDYQTVEVESPTPAPELTEPVHVHDVIEQRSFIRYDIPTADFWRAVRQTALKDPETFRRETGLRIVDEKPKPSASFAVILETYRNKRNKPSDGEIRKVRQYWDFFTDAVSPATTLRDVTPEAVTKWEDAAWLPYHDGGSPKSVYHRFDYVLRLLRYAEAKQVDAVECERLVREIVSRRKELPDLRNPNPTPISVEDFAKLLAAADVRWRAMLLLALNLCYYPCDIRRITKTAIDLQSGSVIFDRAKTGGTTRVGILWRRTVEAIREYQKAEPHDSESLFITQYRAAYTDHGFRNTFRQLREAADVAKSVEFAHIRDGAYSAAVNGGADITTARILAGHKIGGMTDQYVKSNPAIVADACEAIERRYFGESPKAKRAKKGAIL